MTTMTHLTELLKHHVTGAIARGEADPITALPSVIEYRNPLSRSHASITTLWQYKPVRLCGKVRDLTLSHHTAGYVCAGSAMRYDRENWSVSWKSERGIEGRRFKSEAEAREYFESVKSE